MATGAAVLGAFGLFIVRRAHAAAEASGAAGVALGPKFDPDYPFSTDYNLTGDERIERRRAERERWQTCLEARATWLGANARALEALAHRAQKAEEEKKEDKEEDKTAAKKPVSFDAWVTATCSVPDAHGCHLCASDGVLTEHIDYVAAAYKKAQTSAGLHLCKE